MTRFDLWPALLLPAAFLLAYLLIRRADKQKRTQTYTGPFLFGRDLSGLTGLPSVLIWVGLSLMCVALARPQSGYRRLPGPTEGVDLVVTLDISTSMLAKDYRPNRLQAAKRAALEFVEDRPNDRIGLVVYAGEACTLCPATFDHATVKRLLSRVDPGFLQDGTAIGQGLAVAASGLDYSRAERRVIILLSDGVETSGTIDPLTVARALNVLHGDSLRVYTVAIGTTDPTVGYEVDRRTLSEIASMNGGRLFDVYSEADLQDVYASIDSLEASTIPPEELVLMRDHHLPYLWWGLVLLVAGSLLRWRIMAVVGA